MVAPVSITTTLRLRLLARRVRLPASRSKGTGPAGEERNMKLQAPAGLQPERPEPGPHFPASGNRVVSHRRIRRSGRPL